MPYWELYYHIVTTTHERQPIISDAMEPVLYCYLKDKAQELETTIYALNGISDHIHMVVSIPPKLAIATFVGQVKGFSSSQIRQYHPQFMPFGWQSDYSVFSFDKKRISRCVEYVEGQKQHHARGTLILPLEQCQEPHRRIGEEASCYDFDPDWL